jgi:hypothetical protein
MPYTTEGRENITLDTHNPEILLHVRSKTFYQKSELTNSQLKKAVTTGCSQKIVEPTDTNTRRRKRQSKHQLPTTQNPKKTLLQIRSIRFSENSSSIENSNRRVRFKDH